MICYALVKIAPLELLRMYIGKVSGVQFIKQIKSPNGIILHEFRPKKRVYKSLRERIKQLRMNHLFEEPCPLYEPEWETYDHEEEDA